MKSLLQPGNQLNSSPERNIPVNEAANEPFREQLRRVLESQQFRHTEALRRLLSYLGEKSLAGEADDLKEYTIGLEACGKQHSYDPQKDASVRVQISRLRQKLEEYNRTEGSGDPFMIELPKGRFKITFHSREPGKLPRPVQIFPEEVVAHSRRPPRIAYVGIAAVLLAAAVLWGMYMQRKVNSLQRELAASGTPLGAEFEPLWGRFVTPESNTTVVFGSPLFFASSQHKLFARLYDFNDLTEVHADPNFTNIQRRFGLIASPRYDYASMGDALALHRLTTFFGHAGHSLNAVPAHLAVWDSLQEGNLIFLGAIRMNPLIRRLPIKLDFELIPGSKIRNRNPQPGEETIYTTPSHRDAVTYAVVASFPGLRPGQNIILLTAQGTPGIVGAVDYITHSESVKLINEKLKLSRSQPSQYQILLRVFSDNDAPVKTEYVTHHAGEPH